MYEVDRVQDETSDGLPFGYVHIGDGGVFFVWQYDASKPVSEQARQVIATAVEDSVDPPTGNWAWAGVEQAISLHIQRHGMYHNTRVDHDAEDRQMMKFRAECQVDVAYFLVALVEQIPAGKYCRVAAWESTAELPDVVVTLDTNCCRDELLRMMQHVVDSHVMQETLLPSDAFTGNRVPV